MTYIPLARKWRPQDFKEFIGQEHIIQPLQNALSQKKLHHAYIFIGTRGVGKTTIARIFAKALNCQQGIKADPCLNCEPCKNIAEGKFLDLIEVDGASRTRVEDTRDLLENIQYAPVVGRFKIYLIDEVHMLSTHSFNALLKTLEEPPEHVKFLLATTDPQKIPATILSRCLQFHLHALSPELITQQLIKILTAESFPFEIPALHYIAQQAQGSMRDALSLCEQCMASSPEGLREETLKKQLGFSLQDWVEHCISHLLEQDGKKILETLVQLNKIQPSYTKFVEYLLSWFHDCLIYSLSPEQLNGANLTLLAQCHQIWNHQIVHTLYILIEQTYQNLNWAPNPAIATQMLLLRILCYLQEQNCQVHHTHNTITLKEPEPKNTITLKEPEPISNANWISILNQLSIEGLGRSVLQHSTVHDFNDPILTLEVAQNYKALFTQQIKKRIEQALSEFCHSPITIKIQVIHDPTQQQTPAKVATEQKRQEQEKLQQAVLEHPFVQNILQDCQGEILENSMTKIPNDL